MCRQIPWYFSYLFKSWIDTGRVISLKMHFEGIFNIRINGSCLPSSTDIWSVGLPEHLKFWVWCQCCNCVSASSVVVSSWNNGVKGILSSSLAHSLGDVWALKASEVFWGLLTNETFFLPSPQAALISLTPCCSSWPTKTPTEWRTVECSSLWLMRASVTFHTGWVASCWTVRTWKVGLASCQV